MLSCISRAIRSLLGDRQRPHLAVEARVLDSQGGERRKTRQRLLIIGIESGSASFSVR